MQHPHFSDFYMNHVIIQCPYFPMHASSLLPFVDASQLLLQSGLPDDGDGRGPAAVLPQRHINLSKKKKGSEFERLRCAADQTSRRHRRQRSPFYFTLNFSFNKYIEYIKITAV